MPRINDSTPAIRPAAPASPVNPIRPSPLLNGLGLERLSMRELAYHGAQFGIDVPYEMEFTRFGEVFPIFGDT